MESVTLRLLNIILKIYSELLNRKYKNKNNVLNLGYFPNVLQIFNFETENLFASNAFNVGYISFRICL